MDEGRVRHPESSVAVSPSGYETIGRTPGASVSRV